MALSQTSWRAPAGWFVANGRNRTMPSERRSRRVGGAAPASGPGGIQTRLRLAPPAAACGGPSPRAAAAEALCAASFRRGCAPNPRRPLAGTPRAAAAEARRARLHSDGAAPRTPGVRSRGPFAPRRSRRGAPCAASFRRGFAPNPRRSLAGALRPAPLPPRRAVRSFIQTGLSPEPPAFARGGPSPRAAPAEARCARLAEPAPGSLRTPAPISAPCRSGTPATCGS